jgi:ABC-type transport system involved in cytochrome bd biosynthesis fused ATPase/permease subunit
MENGENNKHTIQQKQDEFIQKLKPWIGNLIFLIIIFLFVGWFSHKVSQMNRDDIAIIMFILVLFALYGLWAIMTRSSETTSLTNQIKDLKWEIEKLQWETTSHPRWYNRPKDQRLPKDRPQTAEGLPPGVELDDEIL